MSTAKDVERSTYAGFYEIANVGNRLVELFGQKADRETMATTKLGPTNDAESTDFMNSPTDQTQDSQDSPVNQPASQNAFKPPKLKI